MILVILSILGLGYAIYVQNKTSNENIEALKAPKKRTNGDGLFKPLLGDVQFITMKDRIFSTDITENHIEMKPSSLNSGMYGLTETLIRLNPADPTMIIYGPKIKLNI